MNGPDLFGHILDHLGADAEALISHQGFTAQLEQDPLVLRASATVYYSPTWKRAKRLMVMFSPILAISLVEQIRDGDVRVAHVGLVHQAVFLVRTFSSCPSAILSIIFSGLPISQGLGAVDFHLPVDDLPGHVFRAGCPPDWWRRCAWRCCGQIREIFVFGDEIAFRS